MKEWSALREAYKKEDEAAKLRDAKFAAGMKGRR